MSQAELVFDARHAVGESPIWRGEEQALYWVNIPQGTLWRHHPVSAEFRHWQAPEMLGCVASMGLAKRWIAGAQTGLYAMQTHDDGRLDFSLLAAVAHPQQGMRFNDGRCDRQGRFLAGTMDMQHGAKVGAVYSYQHGGDLRQLLDGFATPNGMAFSPDGCTMYLSDSHPSVQTVWAFDYDTNTGTPSKRRVFVEMKDMPGRPDGAAVDAEGCYWICANDAGLVHRFTPAGKLDRSLALPVKKPSMCAFGGARLDTLYVTSIRPEGVDLADQPLAGGVFALHPGVCGLPEPVFAVT